MARSTPSKYFLLVSVLFFLIGLIPYYPTLFIPKEDYLLVSPQACGCPCPDAVILQGEIIIPPELQSLCNDIRMNECYLEHTKIMDKFTSIGWYNDYYIKGDVTGIDSLMCGEQGCEYAAIINVKEAYLAEYVPIFWSFNRIVVVTYLINLIIVLPVLVIIWLVNIFSRNKKEKPS